MIAPHKRPFNTLSAGFVMRNGRPLMTVTLMGGDMQAQGIAQVLVNVLDLGANLQAATDMARFRHNQVPNVLSLESQLFALVGGPLQAMGHKVESIDGGAVGGYQAILFTPDSNAPAAGGGSQPIKGFYRAGSDHRKDGQAAGVLSGGCDEMEERCDGRPARGGAFGVGSRADCTIPARCVACHRGRQDRRRGDDQHEPAAGPVLVHETALQHQVILTGTEPRKDFGTKPVDPAKLTGCREDGAV